MRPAVRPSLYLIGFASGLFLFGLGSRDFWAPVEPRYAEIARVMIDVAANYRKILGSIAEATAKGGRDAGQVKLLAASKSQSIELILTAVGAGITLIGENYVQEAAGKKPRITAAIEWHMIGHLQRNKAKAAVDLFDVFESLDNLPLARALDKEGQRRKKMIRAFIEINLGGEESKTGVVESEAASFVEQIATLSHLRIEGLMSASTRRVICAAIVLARFARGTARNVDSSMFPMPN